MKVYSKFNELGKPGCSSTEDVFQVENHLHITTVIHLTAAAPAPDLGRVANKHFMAEVFNHLFEPQGTTACFNAGNDLTDELPVVAAREDRLRYILSCAGASFAIT